MPGLSGYAVEDDYPGTRGGGTPQVMLVVGNQLSNAATGLGSGRVTAATATAQFTGLPLLNLFNAANVCDPPSWVLQGRPWSQRVLCPQNNCHKYKYSVAYAMPSICSCCSCHKDRRLFILYAVYNLRAKYILH